MPEQSFAVPVDGISVGHAQDAARGTGVSVVVFERPSIAAVAVAGGAPCGSDTAMLDPAASVERVDAVVLSGGSVFGLDASGGVRATLAASGRGAAFAGMRVPIVVQAALFDLVSYDLPDYRALGQAAAQAASGRCALGSVGAGTGAVTATVQGGFGAASAITATGYRVLAMVAVNAIGSPLIGAGPHFWAAPFEIAGEFGGLGWPARIAPGDLALQTKHGPATTIGVVVTDAALTRPQAHRLAVMAHDGLARALLPAHAPMDGDTLFAVSTGTRAMAAPVLELTELGHLAGLAVARAIARGVFEATTSPRPGAAPCWRERFATVG